MAKKLEVRVVHLEDGHKTIMDALVKMDSKLDGIDHVVRGNGAPGLATKIELQGQQIKELQKLRKNWKDFMVLITSGGVIALVTAAIQHFIQ